MIQVCSLVSKLSISINFYTFSGVVKTLVNTLKGSDCEELKDKMKLLMNTWIKNRQMGEAEAVYRLVKEFHFRESDAKCIFVQTCPRSER